MATTIESREFAKFVPIAPKKQAVMVVDVSEASNKLAISAESVSFSAGAAGTTGVVGLDKAPVYDSTGTGIGSTTDTSFAWVTGTVLTSQVAYDETKSDTLFLASLTNGQYAINYVTGKVYYKKATTGTSDTCNYSTRQINTQIFTSAGASVDSFGLSMTDDSAFTVASSGVTPIGAMADETSPDSVDEGDIGVLRMTLSRFLKVSQGDLLSGEDQSNGLIAMTKKPLAVNTYCMSSDVSAALEASSIAKASAGVLYSAGGRIDSTAATGVYFILFMNSATLPANGAVTMIAKPLAITHTTGTNTPWFVDWNDENGCYASAGIVVCISTTEFTKTIGGAYLSMDLRYV